MYKELNKRKFDNLNQPDLQVLKSDELNQFKGGMKGKVKWFDAAKCIALIETEDGNQVMVYCTGNEVEGFDFISVR